MRVAVTLAWVVVVASGCLAPAAPTATGPANVAETPPDRLQFGELRLVEADDSPQAVLIHADGGVEVDGEVIASLGTDGRMVMHHTGEVVLELDADGNLRDAHGAVVATMADDGSVTVGDRTMTVAADGMVLGTNPNGPPMKLEGATTDGQRRTAMLVMTALSLSAPHPVEPAATIP